jgi:hypothetical protein
LNAFALSPAGRYHKKRSWQRILSASFIAAIKYFLMKDRAYGYEI